MSEDLNVAIDQLDTLHRILSFVGGKTADERCKKMNGTLLYVVALIYKKGTKPFIEACPWTTEIVNTLDYHVQKHWPRMHGTPCTCDVLVLV